jgi:hypothetical protein
MPLGVEIASQGGGVCCCRDGKHYMSLYHCSLVVTGRAAQFLLQLFTLMRISILWKQEPL